MLVENSLFATLDPTVRRSQTPDGREFTVSDTVGFVRNLPHQLVAAFASTLEEVANADLVLHVVDASHPDPEGQIAAVRHVLADVPGALQVPEVLVLNKCDIAEPDVLMRLRGRPEPTVEVSALTGEGLTELLQTVAERLPRPAERVELLLPYSRGDLVAEAHSKGEVLSENHVGEGYQLIALVSEALAARMLQAGTPLAESDDRGA